VVRHSLAFVARRAGLNCWPLTTLGAMMDTTLEASTFPAKWAVQPALHEPNGSDVAPTERKVVTLVLLWQNTVHRHQRWLRLHLVLQQFRALRAAPAQVSRKPA